MPHLHLPIDHTDADLVLAANLAEIVGSEDLYVAWSHGSGAGAVPEVDAVLVESHPPSILAGVVGFVTAFWRALVGRQSHARVDASRAVGPARQGEPSV